jgi:hypothetical protein
MNLMWLAYHLHVKMIDLTKVCMLFLMNHWHAIFQMLLLKKWRWNWVNLFWDWCEWQGAVNMVRNVWIPWNALNLLSSWETCSFWRTTVLLGVCQFLCSELFWEKLFSSVFCLLFYFLCLIHIFFSPPSEETDAFQVCVIQGNQEGAQCAESLIRDIIVNQPLIESSEIFVPQVCSSINS